jgi:competence protein ComEA
MTASPRARLDIAWNRRQLAALMVLLVGAGVSMAWRQASGRVDYAEVPPVNPARVRAASRRIDVNAASVASLRRLPGIGPIRAEAVIAEAARRPFANAEDLQRVRGIGPKTVARIRPYVAVPAGGSQPERNPGQRP